MFKTLSFLFVIIFIEFSKPGVVGEVEDMVLESWYIQIPKISLNDEICYTDDRVCLDYGVWMKYFDSFGNILLTGHSFTLVPFGAGVFYALSDLEEGDLIYIFLDEKRVYIIEDVYVTERYDLEVENFKEMENTLVLYSCFPLWSASERIVIKARLCNLCVYEI